MDDSDVSIFMAAVFLIGALFGILIGKLFL